MIIQITATSKENPEKAKPTITNTATQDEKNTVGSIFQKSPVLAVFEDELQAEVFNSRCHDTGEAMSSKKSRTFNFELNHLVSRNKKSGESKDI